MPGRHRRCRARLVNLAMVAGWVGRRQPPTGTGLTSCRGPGPLVRCRACRGWCRLDFLDPVERDGSVTVGMRWEADRCHRLVVPALDASMTLTAEGEQATAVTLTGVYRSRWARSAPGWTGLCCITLPPQRLLPADSHGQGPGGHQAVSRCGGLSTVVGARAGDGLLIQTSVGRVPLRRDGASDPRACPGRAPVGPQGDDHAAQRRDRRRRQYPAQHH